MSSILYAPGFTKLFLFAVFERPEEDRIMGDMRRHMRVGRYDPNRTRNSVERYVVEPSAIELHGQLEADVARRLNVLWFTRYPKVLRTEVARRIVRTWEIDIAAEGG